MDKEIRTEKIIITYAGDPPVGIFPAQWELGPDLIFEDQEGLDKFKEHIRQAFEYVVGDWVHVATQEEIKHFEDDLEAQCDERIMVMPEITDPELLEKLKKNWNKL